MMNAATVFSPAKLNVFLAVTGIRPDGYHDLVSLAVPLAWGDRLTAEPARSGFTLECGEPGIPLDGANLVLKAASAFRARTGWGGGARFALEKRIPAGAGLGGGSSNAVAALRALNGMAGRPLDDSGLLEVAAGIGSDCPLFLAGGPVVIRGRGERVESLPDAAAGRLRGRRVLVFKPAFAIPTAWAYRRMAGSPGSCLQPALAEERLARWIGASGAPAEELLFNNLEQAAFGKFVALPALLGRIRGDFGVAAGMSGSGSACFAFLPDSGGPSVGGLPDAIRAAWGPSALIVETTVAA